MKAISLIYIFISLNTSYNDIYQAKAINRQEVITKFIEEVFQEHSKKMVYDNKNRFKLIKNFISRASIVSVSEVSNTKFVNLLDIPLKNKFNKKLAYDKNYVVGQYFNPLKTWV